MKLSVSLTSLLLLSPALGFTAPKPVGNSLQQQRRRTSELFYENPRDPPNNNDGNNPNLWSVLATTERWITSTLADSAAGNPLSRKEVSYVCETSSEVAMILANIFRKLKEARLQGETHGAMQEELVEKECKCVELGQRCFIPIELLANACLFPKITYHSQLNMSERRCVKRKFSSFPAAKR
jgi:hypothetical protein